MTIDHSPTFGGLLRRYRREAGLTQEGLAHQAGLSREAISALERGQRLTPHADTVQLLAEALGLPPSDHDEFAAVARPRGSTLASSSSHPNNLRTPPTPLIGREIEVTTACDMLLRDDIRLLTLAGPGGVGKTRLSLQVAADLLHHFPDGVFVAPLARVRDPDLVGSAIAHALGLREQGDRSLPVILTDYLRDKHLLLLLDNFEHVAGAAPLLTGLLAVHPSLHILVTSRAVLRVRGEHTLPIRPLPLPESESLPLEVLEQVPAVALFVQRAQAVTPNFQLISTNAAAVSAICSRLDGLPLAIELAAARSPLLPPQALLARLERRLPLLMGGARDLPERQQTMRRTLAWSYDLLPLGEQALFRRLAVFEGGCTLEAAEAVGEMNTDVLEGLASLVDKNLLYRDAGASGELRVAMLETMREFSWEQLTESGEAAATERRHAEYFLRLAETANPELRGPDQGTWVERLETEHDNLRAVLRWALDGGESELGLRVAADLGRFWYMAGHTGEGRGWLQTLLAQAPTAAPEVRAKALNGASVLAFQQSDLEQAATLGEDSLAISRTLGDATGIAVRLNNLGNVMREWSEYGRATGLYEESLTLDRNLGNTLGIAITLNNLGSTARHQGDYDRAMALHEESLALRREVGDTWGVAYTLNNLGQVAYEMGDVERAAVAIEESLTLRRELGDKHGMALGLPVLGNVARARGDLEYAAALHEESLALFQELGDTWGIAVARHNLGYVARDQGDACRAAALFAESLALFQAVNHPRDIASTLEAVAEMIAVQGRMEQAVRLYGAAAALRERLGAPRPPIERAGYDTSVVRLRQNLGTEAFEEPWSAGASLSLGQIIQEALAEGDCGSAG